ncbi:MAG: large conductance mechanosensitive channel protein MscL [Tenericutes bacterium]|nr:large conductance mechanosensitive channel protein MscL [Bacilli bacterium]NLV90358.1 large conductance mechanosensitive channel protein MscL [Mycoplasmatota bacterium]
MIQEFKKFIFRGNVVDLSIGIIIGGAFTGIVNSLVNNVIMPFLGVLTAGVNFEAIKWDLGWLAKALGNPVPEEGVYMSIGLFINGIVQFLIMALVVFLMVKLINKVKDKKVKEEEKPASKPEDVQLLEQILKEMKKQKK